MSLKDGGAGLQENPPSKICNETTSRNGKVGILFLDFQFPGGSRRGGGNVEIA
jgi:hypothetical protein